MQFKLNAHIEQIFEILKDYQTFIVGGCVRDMIQNKIPSDYDICTSALPNQVIEHFKGFNVIETGIKHGTVTVVIDKIHYEITTFRKDGEYKDSRRPNEIYFVDSLKEDLKRRDFTMNAMAYNYKDGFKDYFGGQDDICKKIIRAVGNPCQRFLEDELRVMRAIRFCATTGFDIENDTKKAILNYNSFNIAMERINIEFSKLLLGEYSLEILNEYKNIIAIFIPEILGHNIEKHANTNDLEINMAVFLINFTKNPNPILKKMKFSNKFIKNVSNLVKYYDADIKNVKQYLNKLGVDMFLKLIEVKKICFNQDFNEIQGLVAKIIENNECFTIKQLNISGEDVKGVVKDSDIGRVLNLILNDVISDKIPNEREKLLEILKKY